MARFGIGIIGAGGIAQAHAAAYRRCAAAALVAFADVNAAAARSAAERHECTALSVDELLARQDIDVISICTPPDSHADLACRALEAGKHVLVEKPLTATLSEADRLCELSERPGAPMVMVAHSHRFWPANQKAKALLDEGAIGTVLSVSDDILAESRYDPANPPWRMRRAVAGGGVVMDNGVHAFDRLRYWLDRPVTAVSGYMWTVT
ncbi:MAG TPA: Gfo/Idh/MocA family oxidoreductase, partial [Limnochordia bacterium]